MRRVCLVLSVVCVTGFLFSAEARACGDKFLVVGRGVAYQRTFTAPHPASILIFKNDNPGVSAAIKDLDLQATLGTAGHKYQVVETPEALESALRSGKYDIVLVDLLDAQSVERQVQSTASKPLVLPIIYNPSKADLAAAREEYNVVLRAPTKTGHLLAVIDDAMTSKQKK